MAKYFKIVEINEDEFIKTTGEKLDCNNESILSIPTNKGVFVGVDEEQEHYFCVNLDCFSSNVNNTWCEASIVEWKELYEEFASIE